MAVEYGGDSHGIASNNFFGARLMASRFNLLNPAYYVQMPKAVRVEALKDMGAFAGMLTVTALAAVAAVIEGIFTAKSLCEYIPTLTAE